MAADLLAINPARIRFDEASDVLGFDLAALCTDGPEERLTRTENAQPAIYVTSYCLSELAAERGLVDIETVRAAAGHSLGEYTALAVAGAFTFEDGLSLVAARGRAMADAGEVNPGAMAALIGPSLAEVSALCDQRREDGGQIWPANQNALSQCVVAGAPDDIDWITENARELGIRRAVRLAVSGAFHSPMMEPAAEVLASTLCTTEISAPSFAVYSNATGKRHGDADEIRIALDVQLTAPVRWVDCIEAIAGQADGSPSGWVCFGPGETVAGLLKRCVDNPEIIDASSSGVIEDAALVAAGVNTAEGAA